MELCKQYFNGGHSIDQSNSSPGIVQELGRSLNCAGKFGEATGKCPLFWANGSPGEINLLAMALVRQSRTGQVFLLTGHSSNRPEI
ncbi:hypothetical protein RRG08_017773 [Elysia crispata]|uniref:Uncharacterized protein n=1 Tax=Elysia crispata TaxID=231223 RepID=A0AAE1D648_9GAST|nr:hypothetical protein RRG08_017773 [Elysia crispata]